jgi:ElaB/YqjD/DUF883 family membrane-anchored ribosome-binding protein
MATPSKKTQIKEKVEDKFDEAVDELQAKAEETYDRALDRLKYERDNLERELKHEYRNARRYVRANPQRGLGIAFFGGIIAGILLSQIGRR